MVVGIPLILEMAVLRCHTVFSCVYKTKVPRRRSSQNLEVFVVFRMYSCNNRLKLVRKQSSGFQTKLQDGVHEGPRERVIFPVNSLKSRGREKVFFRKLSFGLSYTEFIKMAGARKRSGVSYRQHGVEAF